MRRPRGKLHSLLVSWEARPPSHPAYTISSWPLPPLSRIAPRSCGGWRPSSSRTSRGFSASSWSATTRYDSRMERVAPRPDRAENRGAPRQSLRGVGDGSVHRFPSAVDAVRWAREIQRGVAQALDEPEGALSDAFYRYQRRRRYRRRRQAARRRRQHRSTDSAARRAPARSLLRPRCATMSGTSSAPSSTDLGERELKNISRPVSLPAGKAGRADFVPASYQPYPDMDATARRSPSAVPEPGRRPRRRVLRRRDHRRHYRGPVAQPIVFRYRAPFHASLRDRRPTGTDSGRAGGSLHARR